MSNIPRTDIKVDMYISFHYNRHRIFSFNLPPYPPCAALRCSTRIILLHHIVFPLVCDSRLLPHNALAIVFISVLELKNLSILVYPFT